MPTAQVSRTTDSCNVIDAMSQDKTLHAAREAYRQGAWADATDLFLRADAEGRLAIEDLEALVWAAGISARDGEMLAALDRVYAHHAASEDQEACARAAFWSGLRHMMIEVERRLLRMPRSFQEPPVARPSR